MDNSPHPTITDHLSRLVLLLPFVLSALQLHGFHFSLACGMLHSTSRRQGRSESESVDI